MKRKKMKRLVLAEWIVFRKRNDGFYNAVNTMTDGKTVIRKEEIMFLKLFDGKTDPMKIKTDFYIHEKELFIKRMYRCGVLRDKRFAEKHFLTCLVTLWEPENTVNLRVFAYIINKLLYTLWLPVLILGCIFFFNSDSLGESDIAFITPGSIVGLIAGMFFHEMGHMFACLASSGRVYETGVMINCGLPGAYVIMDTDKVHNKMKRIQINAAGIEMNFLLAGAILFLQGISYELNGFILGFSINNLFMGLLNLTFIRGFDGMAIMSELLGTDDVAGKALNVIFDTHRKKHIKRRGISGKATVAVCYLLQFLQLALPALLVINLVEVIGWFL